MNKKIHRKNDVDVDKNIKISKNTKDLANEEKKSKKKQSVKNILTSLCVTSIAVSSTVLIKNAIVSNNNFLKDNAQIESDAKFLNADLSILELDKSKLLTDYTNKKATSVNTARLKPNENDKIYVYLDDSLDKKIKENINISLNYCEDLFTNINNSYAFKLVDEVTYNYGKLTGKTTIKYSYSDIEQETTIATTTLSYYKSLFNFDSNIYYVNSVISLDKNWISALTQDEILYVLNHELMHCFGFNDTYSGYCDTTSIMNVNMLDKTFLISPNDYKMLYAAYGNKHINSDGSINIKKLQEIKNKIDIYEKTYYDFIIKNLIKKYNYKVLDFDKSEIQNSTFNFVNNLSYSVKISNDKFTLTSNNTFNGEVVYGKNYAILSSIITNNNIREYLVITKNENSQFQIAFIEDFNLKKIQNFKTNNNLEEMVK